MKVSPWIVLLALHSVVYGSSTTVVDDTKCLNVNTAFVVSALSASVKCLSGSLVYIDYRNSMIFP